MQLVSLRIYLLLSKGMAHLAWKTKRGDTTLVPREQAAPGIEAFRELARELRSLGLGVSAITAEKLEGLLASEEPDLGRLRSFGEELMSRLWDEAGSTVFLGLGPKEALLYLDPRKGWESVVESFPGAGYDIEEASSCLALNRYTAVVIHLMRAVEVGLEALKSKVGVTAFSPNWQAGANLIRSALSKSAKKDRVRAQVESDGLVEDLLERFLAIKDSVRNPVMHVADRIYTDEEAEEVYHAVRAFMRCLANSLPRVLLFELQLAES